MANPSKRKGTDGENAIVDYLRENGWVHTERRALQGSLDKGDIAGIPGVIFEVKNAKTLKWPEWLAETEQERVNASADFGFLWAKRPGKGSPADWYVMMTGSQLVAVLKGLGY